MKRVVGVVFVLVMLSGCSLLTSDLFTSDFQSEFLSYVNDDLQEVGDMEAGAIDSMNAVTGANYTDDATLKTALETDVIPPYTEVVDKLKAIELQEEELQDLHEQYVQGAESQLEGFEKALEAIDTQDQTLVNEANQLMMEGQKQIEGYTKGMQELSEEHNLEYTTEGME
ncbi:hypothetical protein LCM20_09125 [Halobacillus litoralis]|uniref:hypothetical protein n=1 Tax=Halobacillus litoralis TaxID=45668 RepID=UPI001CD6628D|nr:hypothetical protein [Halobacillus litoralis]MCA0970749.1 hypothetical protein [Halobacillus litoralis]